MKIEYCYIRHYHPIIYMVTLIILELFLDALMTCSPEFAENAKFSGPVGHCYGELIKY